MLDVDFVVTVHDEIIARLGGLGGFAGIGRGSVEAALARVENHALYADLNDVLGIAALYAEAIARGHVFNDGNKRTALTCAIAYLAEQGIHVREDPVLEDATVMLAEGTWTRDDFAWALSLLADPPLVWYKPRFKLHHYPGALRLLSLKLPEAFPYHRNWKTSATHPAYWQLYATVDHVVPVTRGGRDDESNLVTTSMLRNSAKGAWLVEELGWELRAGGQSGEWDGLMSWFVTRVAAEPSLLQEPFLRRWYAAAKRCAAAPCDERRGP